MTSYRFRNVDEVLDSIPEDELELCLHLRSLIHQTLPGITEKVAYNVIFYKLNKNICFTWPASITWGKRKTYQGVRLGFTTGYRLQDSGDILDRGSRKQVYWIDLVSVEQLEKVKSRLVDLLQQAEAIDQSIKIR